MYNTHPCKGYVSDLYAVGTADYAFAQNLCLKSSAIKATPIFSPESRTNSHFVKDAWIWPM